LADRRHDRRLLVRGRAPAPRVPPPGGPGPGALAGRGGAHAAPRGADPRGIVKPEAPPPPTYAFGYRRPPLSGNTINGLGEEERSRARKVFHSSGGERLAWKALDDFFSVVNPWSVVRHIVTNTWRLRCSDGPVGPKRRPVEDPRAMADEVKAAAKRLGAALAGVAE